MLKVPLCAPITLGKNVTLTAQLAPAGTLVPQALVCAYSPLVAPEISTLSLHDALPILLANVKVCAPLVAPNSSPANVTDAGDSVATGPMPVPESVTVCGL